VFHPITYCAMTQNAPVLLLSRRKPLLTSDDLTFNEASGQSESLTVLVHDPAHLHTGVCLATHTRTLLLPFRLGLLATGCRKPSLASPYPPCCHLAFTK